MAASAQNFPVCCPDDHHPHLIDLGLPSGTKWACCNVGSEAPEDEGDYFAWGETDAKRVYDWPSYSHCDGTKKTCHKLGKSISGSKYDVATVEWGDLWQMPSKDQIKELVKNCKYRWISVDGINGNLFTSKNNGASIFLPAGGFFFGATLYYRGHNGYYWTGTLSPARNSAYYFNSYRYGVEWYNSDFRSNGYSVRPVAK